VAGNIDELKERLNRKHANDYAIAREIISESSADDLETELREMEGWLPRFGQTILVWRPYIDNEEFENGKWVWLIENPPEEEINYEGSVPKWKDRRGWVWYYEPDQEGWGSHINLMAYVRAIRDELSERHSREFLQDQLLYDS
jgi:hypothetical protein